MLNPFESGAIQFLEDNFSQDIKCKSAEMSSDTLRRLLIGGGSTLIGGLGGYALGKSDMPADKKSLITAGTLGPIGIGVGANLISDAPWAKDVGVGAGGFTAGAMLGKALGEKMRSNQQAEEVQQVEPQHYDSYGYNQYADPYGDMAQSAGFDQYYDPYSYYYG